MTREYVVKVTDELVPDAFQRFENEWSPEQEIVRCRDCKRARLVEWGDHNIDYECHPPATDDMPEAYLEPAHTPWHEGDFYCAYGERKGSD